MEFLKSNLPAAADAEPHGQAVSCAAKAGPDESEEPPPEEVVLDWDDETGGNVQAGMESTEDEGAGGRRSRARMGSRRRGGSQADSPGYGRNGLESPDIFLAGITDGSRRPDRSSAEVSINMFCALSNESDDESEESEVSSGDRSEDSTTESALDRDQPPSQPGTPAAMAQDEEHNAQEMASPRSRSNRSGSNRTSRSGQSYGGRSASPRVFDKLYVPHGKFLKTCFGDTL